MIDESMDKEQMKQPPQPWEFRSKPAWQRLIIMLGGVTVNLALGFLIYIMILFVWGKDTLTHTEVPLGLEPTPVAQSIGFEEGDKILSVDGSKLDNVLDVNRYLFLRNPKLWLWNTLTGEKKSFPSPTILANRCLKVVRYKHSFR